MEIWITQYIDHDTISVMLESFEEFDPDENGTISINAFGEWMNQQKDKIGNELNTKK